jgi:hypothetical protein
VKIELIELNDGKDRLRLVVDYMDVIVDISRQILRITFSFSRHDRSAINRIGGPLALLHGLHRARWASKKPTFRGRETLEIPYGEGPRSSEIVVERAIAILNQMQNNLGR